MYHQEQSGAKFSVKFLIDEWEKSDKNWRVTVAKKIRDTNVKTWVSTVDMCLQQQTIEWSRDNFICANRAIKCIWSQKHVLEKVLSHAYSDKLCWLGDPIKILVGYQEGKRLDHLRRIRRGRGKEHWCKQ